MIGVERLLIFFEAARVYGVGRERFWGKWEGYFWGEYKGLFWSEASEICMARGRIWLFQSDPRRQNVCAYLSPYLPPYALNPIAQYAHLGRGPE